jgi:hypothetical protein
MQDTICQLEVPLSVQSAAPARSRLILELFYPAPVSTVLWGSRRRRARTVFQVAGNAPLASYQMMQVCHVLTVSLASTPQGGEFHSAATVGRGRHSCLSRWFTQVA